MAGLARRAAINPAFRDAVVLLSTDFAMDVWVRRHFVYTPEPFEIIMSPERALEEIQTYGYFRGDCDDAATLYAAIHKARGIPAEFVAIRTLPGENFQHVFERRADTGQVFDATVPRNTQYEYFAMMTERV